MTKVKFDPFKNLILDSYEQEIEDAINDGTIKPLKISKQLSEKYAAMAKEDLAKNKNINIRISNRTLSSLKTKAARLGLGYQTLVGSILHQYANS
jgi:predicted DNA binding CopG/RHH family protein